MLDGNYTRVLSCFEQILEATLHKKAAIWPLASHLTNQLNKMNKTTDKVKFMSDVLLWTATHRRASVD